MGFLDRFFGQLFPRADRIELRCNDCRKDYILGVNAAVTPMESVLGDFMLVAGTPSGQPDLITHTDFRLLAPEQVRMIREDVKIVERAKAMKQYREWKCKHCGAVSKYPWCE